MQKQMVALMILVMAQCCTTASYGQNDSVKMQMYTSEHFGLHFKYMDGFSLTDHSTDRAMELTLRYKSVPNTFLVKTIPDEGRSIETVARELYDHYTNHSENASLANHKMTPFKETNGIYSFGEFYDFNGTTFQNVFLLKGVTANGTAGVMLNVEYKKADMDTILLIAFELLQAISAYK